MRHVWEGDIKYHESLWRYMKIDHFFDLIESSEMYFAAAAQFEDRFEGAVAIQSPEFKVDPRYRPTEFAEKAFRELKRLTKVTCWHRADYESDAMWKLYASQGKGIAIHSTPRMLAESLEPFRLDPSFGPEDLWGGSIHYEDLTQVRLGPGMIQQLFNKHQVFAWEREFRLAISLRMAEENAVAVPTDGIRVSVCVDKMVDRIILGPTLLPQERSRTEAAVDAVGLRDRLEISSLSFTPRFF